jgi:hypothetical protein
MAREGKTALELHELVTTHIQRNPSVTAVGAQWFKIEPVRNDANRTWRVAHSGEGGGLHAALDQADAELTKRYDLKDR